jgi:hypothetical protein
MILTVIIKGIMKAATVLSISMKVYNILYHVRSYINVMLDLQSSSDSQHILPSSSSDTYAQSSDCAHHFGNMNVEVVLDVQEEGEVNVKAEKGICSEEDDSVGVKDEQGIYSEEEEEEEKDVDTKDEEDVDIEEEVS